jgi:hypothetical protein
MDQGRREQVLAAARELGPEKFNRLVGSASEVRARGRLRFWQEQTLAHLSAICGQVVAGPADFLAVFDGVPLLPVPRPMLTRDDFLRNPSRYYFSGEVDILPEWVQQAWDTDPAFRENVTRGLSREASKNGDLRLEAEELQCLARALRDDQAVGLYVAIRIESPHREVEFRPAFARVFGERMAAFPPPLSKREIIAMLGGELAEQLDVPEDEAYSE